MFSLTHFLYLFLHRFYFPTFPHSLVFFSSHANVYSFPSSHNPGFLAHFLLWSHSIKDSVSKSSTSSCFIFRNYLGLEGKNNVCVLIIMKIVNVANWWGDDRNSLLLVIFLSFSFVVSLEFRMFRYVFIFLWLESIINSIAVMEKSMVNILLSFYLYKCSLYSLCLFW